jgi:hypothetical protein
VAPYKKNDFGGTIGGPVYIPGVYNTSKQKTFFFYSEEWRREVEAGENFNVAVPYSAERSGNFNDVCPNPTTGSNIDCPINPATGNPYLNNTITPTAAGLALLPLIPVGTSDVPGNAYYIASPTQPTTWREELFKIDHNLTAHNRVTFHYVHDSWDQIQPSTLWTGSAFPTVQTDYKGPAISMLARLTSTISPTLLNEFVASYTTDHITLHSTGTPNPNAWQLPSGGIPGMGYLFPVNGGRLPMITLTGGNAYGGGFFMDPGGEYQEGPYNSNPTYTYRDNMTKIIGKHNLQFGAYFVAAQKNELSGLFTDGQLFFNSSSISATVGGQPLGTGNAFADLLLGNIASFSQGSAQIKFYNRYKIFEPYIQDDWRATPRLTLNVGLRISMYGTYREKYKHAYNWDPAAYKAADAPELDPGGSGFLVPGVGNPYDGLVQCGVGGVPVGCSSGHLFNPAPRIGFAYDPWGNGKTAIRGGYGIFFEHTNGDEANTESLEGQSSPLAQVATQNNIPGYENIGAAGALPPFGFISIPDKTTWPYMQQWHFDIQQELPQHVVLTVAYVGSKGTHLTRQSDSNQLYPTSAANNPYTPGEPIGPNDCTNGTTQNGAPIIGYTPGGLPSQQTGVGINMFVACGGDADYFRPYAGISAVTRIETAASSNYNALQISGVRTMGGLSLDVAYTWSHSIDDSSDRYDSGFVNAYDWPANRASSSFDVRQQITVAYVYDLPFFKQPGLSHTLLGSWQWSGITSFSTGTPFSVFNKSTYTDNAGVGDGSLSSGSYADKIGDPYTNIPPNPGGPQVAGFLYNPNAYNAPQGLTFGDSGRNSLHNPSRLNFDMALFKSFAVTESKHFEFRAEAFNVFNHTQWLPIYGDAGSAGYNNSSGTNGYGAANFFQFLGAHNPRILQLGAKFIF